MKNSNEVSNKKEKKNGLMGLLNSGASNTGTITPGVIGGSANAAASSGLAALFSAKVLGTVLTVAIVGAAGMVGISNNSSIGGDAPDSEMMMASAQEAANYVPALQRSEEANEGKSSIAMFNETNKGAVKFDVDPTLNNKNGKNADGSEGIDGADGEGYDADGLTDSGMADMAEGAMASGSAEAAGLNNSNLSTSFGNDKSSKSINMGGNNKPKLKTTFKPMANLKPMTKFNSNKALAYSKGKQAKRISATRVGSRGGSRALNQARAMNNQHRAAAMTSNFTTARAMWDASWESTTGDSESTETLDAGGLSEGEGMTVAPLSNTSPNSTGVGETGDGMYIPPVSGSVDVTPWSSDLQTLQTCIMAALGLLSAAALLVSLANKCASTVFGAILAAALRILSIALVVAAVALAGYAVFLATKLMWDYKQYKLGAIWLALSGGAFATCLIAAISAGTELFAPTQGTALGSFGAALSGLQSMIFGVAAVGSIGMMLAGSLGDKTVNKEEAEKYCKDNPSHEGCPSIPDINTSKANTLYELADTPINNVLLS